MFAFRFRPSQFTVKLGEWDLKDSDIYSQEFRIIEITAHPDFKANGFYNDVAIFKLDQPAYFNECVILYSVMFFSVCVLLYLYLIVFIISMIIFIFTDIFSLFAYQMLP